MPRTRSEKKLNSLLTTKSAQKKPKGKIKRKKQPPMAYAKTTLIGDERIVYAAKLHYWSSVFPALLTLVGAFILFAPNMPEAAESAQDGVMSTVEMAQNWIGNRLDDVKKLVPKSVEPYFDAATGFRQYVIGLLCFGFGMGGVVSSYVKKRTLEFVVTTDKVVFKKGFIQRDATELNLERIESVKVFQNAFDRSIGKGRVFIMGIGMEQVNLKNIANPVKFHHIVLEQMSKKRQSHH